MGWIRSRAPQYTPDELNKAKSLGLAPQESRSLTKLSDAKQGQAMSDADFKLLTQVASGDNARARVNALVGLRAVAPNSPHSEEAIRLATRYLDEHHEEGNVAAVQVLKYQNHPSWRSHVTRLMKEGSPESRDMWQEVLNSK